MTRVDSGRRVVVGGCWFVEDEWQSKLFPTRLHHFNVLVYSDKSDPPATERLPSWHGEGRGDAVGSAALEVETREASEAPSVVGQKFI